MVRFFRIAVLLMLALPIAANESDVEYRQGVMSSIGSTMGSIGMILKQEVARPNDIAPLASALDELASTASGLFPDGSEGGDALSGIWENPDDFAEKIEAFKRATTALRSAAASGDMSQIGPATRDVGMACKACHDEYRD